MKRNQYKMNTVVPSFTPLLVPFGCKRRKMRNYLVKPFVTLLSCLFVLASLAHADLNPVNSNEPVFRFLGKKVDFTVSAIRSLIVPADKKGVTVVLNEADRKKLVELLKKLSRDEIRCEVMGFETEKDKQFAQQVGQPVHEVWKLSAISVGEDGILEFGETNGGVEAANYLRHRFGK